MLGELTDNANGAALDVERILSTEWRAPMA
jgi:hypothetical protein